MTAAPYTPPARSVTRHPPGTQTQTQMREHDYNHREHANRTLPPPRAHADKLGIQRTSRVMMTEWPSAANCRLADRLDFFGEYENMIPPRRLLWMGRDVSGHGIYVMVAPTRAMWRKDKSTVWRVVHSESPAPALHNMLRDNVYREQCAVCLLCP